MNKIVCIDYDGTYTRFPELLDTIIDKSRELGYEVILATMRYENESDMGFQDFCRKVDRVIYTKRKAKMKYLLENGIIPDLWIDDNPNFLLKDAKIFG